MKTALGLVGCALIIPMIIQTIGLNPSGAVWTDEASNLSRPDPTGSDHSDAERQARNRKVLEQCPVTHSETMAVIGAHRAPE